jgi:hypothetical protein
MANIFLLDRAARSDELVTERFTERKTQTESQTKQLFFPYYFSEQCCSFSGPSAGVNSVPFSDTYHLILYVVSTHQTYGMGTT